MDELESLREPNDVGRRLDAGGFVFAAPFDELLRYISADYLEAAWTRLRRILASCDIALPDGLSWGYLHAGETDADGLVRHVPSNFTGWTSRQLAYVDYDERYVRANEKLRRGDPPLALATTWRSLKWRIAPDDYASAFQLIEALWTGESTDWHPPYLTSHPQLDQSEAWLKVAKAILENDQVGLTRTLTEARAQYSPLGFRILLRANAEVLERNYFESPRTVRLPLI